MKFLEEVRKKLEENIDENIKRRNIELDDAVIDKVVQVILSGDVQIHFLQNGNMYGITYVPFLEKFGLERKIERIEKALKLCKEQRDNFAWMYNDETYEQECIECDVEINKILGVNDELFKSY